MNNLRLQFLVRSYELVQMKFALTRLKQKSKELRESNHQWDEVLRNRADDQNENIVKQVASRRFLGNTKVTFSDIDITGPMETYADRREELEQIDRQIRSISDTVFTQMPGLIELKTRMRILNIPIFCFDLSLGAPNIESQFRNALERITNNILQD